MPGRTPSATTRSPRSRGDSGRARAWRSSRRGARSGCRARGRRRGGCGATAARGDHGNLVRSTSCCSGPTSFARPSTVPRPASRARCCCRACRRAPRRKRSRTRAGRTTRGRLGADRGPGSLRGSRTSRSRLSTGIASQSRARARAARPARSPARRVSPRRAPISPNLVCLLTRCPESAPKVSCVGANGRPGAARSARCSARRRGGPRSPWQRGAARGAA